MNELTYDTVGSLALTANDNGLRKSFNGTHSPAFLTVTLPKE